MISYKDVTAATNERTAIFAILPRTAVGHTALLAYPDVKNVALITCFITCANSLIFDYLVRQKMGGIHLSFTVLYQIPFLPPSAFSEADIAFIVPRVLELVYTAWDMQPFAEP